MQHTLRFMLAGEMKGGVVLVVVWLVLGVFCLVGWVGLLLFAWKVKLAFLISTLSLGSMTRLIRFLQGRQNGCQRCADAGGSAAGLPTPALHKHGSPVPAQMAGKALGQSAQKGLPEPAFHARQTSPALPRTARPLPLFWHPVTDLLFYLSVPSLIN